MAAYRVYAHVLGAEHAESIVFLPGFAGSHDMWNDDFQALATRYWLVMLDTLGFGRSPKPTIDYTLDQHLAAMHTTLQSLHLSRCHIVGHSMGCLLGLAYTCRFPEQVGKLVLLALPCYRNEQEARDRVKNSSLFNRWLALDTPLAHVACGVMCALRPLLIRIAPLLAPDVPAVVARDALRHTWASYSRTLQHVIFQATPQPWLRETHSPVLIIQGTRDRIAPIENVQQAIDQLDHVRLITLDADHRSPFTHSQIITAAITAFLQTSTHAASRAHTA